MKLIIFDLDQTLVDYLPTHDRATQELFRRFFGVDGRLSEIDFAGRSLLDNFAVLARHKGVPEEEIARKLYACLNSYERIFAALLPDDGPGHVLPGVKELLEELPARDCLPALYTGGSPGIVGPVLAATGLAGYFKVVACGTEAESRPAVARLAIERAQEMTGVKFEPDNIFIIGDSVRDVDCGKELRARTIAVATGFHSAAQLLERKPDYLFPNLADYRKVLEAIGA